MALLGSFGHLLLLFLPPFLLAAYPSPVCNVWSKTPSQLDICQDPSFDAAVSVSESQMLLFKGRHMWLLDILNYQVSLPQANCLLDSCLAPTSPSPSPQMDPPQSPPLYFVWNEHSNAHGHSQHLDRICVQGVSTRDRSVVHPFSPFIASSLPTLIFAECQFSRLSPFCFHSLPRLERFVNFPSTYGRPQTTYFKAVVSPLFGHLTAGMAMPTVPTVAPVPPM